MALPSTIPPLRTEQMRHRQLVVTKRRATLLLAATSVVFLAVTVAGAKSTWAGYLQATAEASMVGGLADWFAVTALFRRPLGLPIPHTAIIVERKDQFAATLGDFIRESFLTQDAVAERLRAAGLPGRVSRWLSDPTNGARVSKEIADAAVAVVDLTREEDVRIVLEQLVRDRLVSVDVAAVAGQALRFATEGGRHAEALTAAFLGLERYLDQHQHELRQRLGEQSPWWLPGAVEDRVFKRLVDGGRAVLGEMAAQPAHPLRQDLEAGIAQLAREMQTSPAWHERGERLKQDALSQPQLSQWIAALWRQVKDELRAQASDGGSTLRTRLTHAIIAGGDRIGSEPKLGRLVDDTAVAGASYVVEHFDAEIAALVTATIARWDGAETARRLELLLGPDLQYIRINGTVVGAAAGLVLHALARALG
jgi:uncharacterized membrane-anchored protein YjiN (DUF445 family)